MIKFADRLATLKGSEIRESYKIMSLPGMRSLAAGSPDPALFPVADLKAAANKVFDENGTEACAYMATEGYTPLRKKIAERMNSRGIKCDYTNIHMTTGSQQGIEMSAKVFVNEGEYIAVESPSYMGAFTAFSTYNPEYVNIPTDEYGMIPEELEKALETNPNIKMIYIIPNFQNPTGHTWTLERRKKFIEIVNKYNIPVIEDDPYGEIRFEGEDIPPVKAFDTKGLVVYLGSFSKILAPGFRVGWLVAEPEIFKKYYTIKQGVDMHSTGIVEIIIDKYLEMFDINAHIEKISKSYKHKKDTMLAAMEKYFPSCVKWSKPEGGLFVWVTLPEDKNAKELLQICIENKVIFIAGAAFYPYGDVFNTFRMSFATLSDDMIEECIKAVGSAMDEFFAK